MQRHESEGKFEATITHVSLDRTQGGALQAALRCLTEEGVITGYVYPVLKDGSLNARCMEDLKAIGWTGSSMQSMYDDLTDKRCSITCEMETYNGNTSLKVKWINPPGGTGATIDEMEDLFSKAQLGMASEAPGTMGLFDDVAAQRPTDDDVPY